MKFRALGPGPRVDESVDQGGAQELALLTRAQVILMQLVQAHILRTTVQTRASLIVQLINNPPAMQETPV